MALKALIKEIEFGVGDKIRVIQKLEEGGKGRISTFEGLVLAIRGRATGASFVVRRIGEAGVAIERIFPLGLPTIEKIEIVKKGLAGVRHSKLYYTRDKSAREIDQIYTRAARKNQPQKPKASKRKHAAKKKK